MSSRSMSLDVLVRLRDLLTGPLKRLQGALKSLASFASKIGILGTAIAAISFMGPIKEAAAFQQKLLDIAGTAELSGKAAFKFVDEARAKYESLALAAGQASDTIAAGAGLMIATGVDRALVDATIGDIASAATAANAEFNDMAGVATSMLTTLKLPADQLRDSMAALIMSGKLGAFELKDMARYFPTLTSQMSKFGVTGREAVNFLGAALQVARKGTADPAEAANNLKNFLSKILAPATIKNFKDLGVDIQAVMRDATTKGINPIEAVLQKITKVTGVSGKEIEGLLKKAKANGLEGADALAQVREQLMAIHGAGALGEIFADQQVMDFLIPFMANVDEFKRIKEEVSKATGAITDADFETQMAGLNRQLMTFQEVGTQAVREVGFAFGAWLPEINAQLMAGLKWYREWNKESGGMGTRLLTMAGAGVLALTAIGALGVALPIIGAGFGALAALISPIGVLLAGIGLGAMHLYKNWNTYGPRVARIWNSAKRGFEDMVEGIRDRGRRLWSAAGDIFDAIGPRISRGLSSAWADIKGGWGEIKSFFDSIAKAADIKIDLSGLTIDNAKVVAIRALGGALDVLAKAWEAMKGFGAGFAIHLPDIGKDIGKTIKDMKEIASSLGRLGAALWSIGGAVGSLVGIDTGKAGAFFTMLGDWAGKATQWQFDFIGKIAGDINLVVAAIANFAEKAAAGKINWSSLVPDKAKDGWNAIKDAVSAVAAAIEKLIDLAKTGLNWASLLPAGGMVKTITDLAAALKTISEALSGWKVPDNIFTKDPDPNAPKDARTEFKNPILDNVMNPETSAVQRWWNGALGGGDKQTMPTIDNWKDLAEAGKVSNTIILPKPANDNASPSFWKSIFGHDYGAVPDTAKLPKVEMPQPIVKPVDKTSSVTNDAKGATIVTKNEMSVNGSITVTATGGAQVVSTSSGNPKVPIRAATGQRLGRV